MLWINMVPLSSGGGQVRMLGHVRNRIAGVLTCQGERVAASPDPMPFTLGNRAVGSTVLLIWVRYEFGFTAPCPADVQAVRAGVSILPPAWTGPPISPGSSYAWIR